MEKAPFGEIRVFLSLQTLIIALKNEKENVTI